MGELLALRKVAVEVEGNRVLSNVNLSVKDSELHVVLGPNGSGKTTLLAGIAGLKPYRVVEGEVLFNGVNVTEEPPHIRVRRGLVLAHQLPPPIKGVKGFNVVEELTKKFKVDSFYERKLRDVLEVEVLLGRDLFTGMSGGEKKRLETYLTLLIKPKLAMLDEPDSGVDIDSINNIAEGIKLALSQGVSILLVTHSLFMLKLLKNQVNKVHMLYGGTLIYSGLYDEVVPLIEKYGYTGAVNTLVVKGWG